MSVKRSLCVALGGAVLFPALALASEVPGSADSQELTLTPAAQTSKAAAAAAPNGGAPLYLAAAPPADEAPNIHGFANVSFGTSYITPRGLVVENAGIVIQPVFGLVLPIASELGPLKNFTLVGGVWNCITSNQHDDQVGSWNEMDFFFSMGADVAAVPGLNATLTYGAWSFPQSTPNKPQTEHNLDLKISYSDKWLGPDFAINPYVDIFYAVAGSSTVVLGKQGDTGYVEVGVAPSFKFKGIPNYPVSLSFPTYVSFGGSEYWGGEGNFGVLSTAVNASIPMSFIPSRYGHWHADFGVQYYNLLNGTLLDAGTILSGNTERNIFRGYVGFGVGF